MERKELSTNVEYGIIFINLFVFLIAPYLPNVVYDSFVETYVGAILLLLLVLYSIIYGYLVTVSTFTAVASLFAESHARKASKVKGAAHLPVASPTINGVNAETTLLNPDKMDEVIAPVQKLVPKETHPESHTPDDDPAEKTVTFTAKDDDNTFKPVDASIDEKEPLPTISLSKDVANIYEKSANFDKMDE